MNWLVAIMRWIVDTITGYSSTPRDDKVAQIQAAAVQACGFLPMYESVIALLAVTTPATATATAIATSICAAITKNGLKPALAEASMLGIAQQVSYVVVNGVTVKGTMVGKK